MKLSPQRVRRLREEMALSQQGLADLAGVSLHSVHRLERASRGGNVMPSTARKLAAALQVQPRDLMEPEASTIPLAAEPALESYHRMVRRLEAHAAVLEDKPNPLEAALVGQVASMDTIMAIREQLEAGEIPFDSVAAGKLVIRLGELYGTFGRRLEELQGQAGIPTDPEDTELLQSAKDLRGAA